MKKIIIKKVIKIPTKYNEKSTLIGRLGFNDTDLKLQTHDDIIVWLNKKETILEILKNNCLLEYELKGIYQHYFLESLNTLQKIFDFNKMNYELRRTKYKTLKREYRELKRASNIIDWKISKKKGEIKETRRLLTDFREELFSYYIYKREISGFKFEIHIVDQKGDIEYIVKNDRNYEIGFIDLHKKIKIECHPIQSLDDYEIREARKEIIPLKAKVCKDPHIRELYFEVKTQYNSLGILMRQLNLYRENILRKYGHQQDYEITDPEQYNRFFLVGPINKQIEDFGNILDSNGWTFIEIPEVINQKNEKNPQKSLSSFIETNNK